MSIGIKKPYSLNSPSLCIRSLPPSWWKSLDRVRVVGGRNPFLLIIIIGELVYIVMGDMVVMVDNNT